LSDFKTIPKRGASLFSTEKTLAPPEIFTLSPHPIIFRAYHTLMKTISFALLLTFAFSCGEKRTITQEINDLTPKPTAEMLRFFKMQDCLEKQVELKNALAPLEMKALTEFCPSAEVRAKIVAQKAQLEEKKIEVLYITESGKMDNGFDHDSKHALKVSVSEIETKELELKTLTILSTERGVENKVIPNVFFEEVVTSGKAFRRMIAGLEYLNSQELIIRKLDEARSLKGNFPILLSDSKCEITDKALIIKVKSNRILGTTAGAIRKCLKSLKLSELEESED